MNLLKFCGTTALTSVFVVLVACGGGGGGGGTSTAPTPVAAAAPTPTPSFSVGGSVVGLGNSNGLTLINGSETLPVGAGAMSFTFTNKVLQNATFSVSIGSQPSGATCTVSNASGTVALADIQSIKVGCAPVQRNGPYTVSTFAGDDGQTYVDGVGASARFGTTTSVAMDSTGNMYVADIYTIRKVSPSGVVTTLAGNGERGFVNGAGASAKFAGSLALAIDGSDNLYVADWANNAIRKISPTGVVTTLAGNGPQGFVDGAGTAARFANPSGVAVDGAGNVYVADSWNDAIRKITPGGVVSTLAGGTHGYADGTGGAAHFSSPTGLAVDGVGNVYVADRSNYVVRKITPLGVVTTVAGKPGTAGYLDGAGSIAKFDQPNAVAVDGLGNLYVSDLNNNAVRLVASDATVTTLAGGTIGYADGTGVAARFTNPTSPIVNAAGSILVADSRNRAIRAVSSTGVVTTIAGQGPVSALVDAVGTSARFGFPAGVAIDGAGNLYVADQNGYAIRKITPSGVTTTLAGGVRAGNVDATAAAAQFTSPSRIAADSAGNVYVTDDGAIRKISPTGETTTLQQVANAQGVAVDGNGTIYITTKNSVLTMSTAGVVTVLAGNDSAGSVDGVGAAARFNAPRGVALDSAGNVYVADSRNYAIRKISPQGQVTTLVANGPFGVSGPVDVAVDGAGIVYAIGDAYFWAGGETSPVGAGSVSKVTNDGVVTVIAGGSTSGRADGPGSTARFYGPLGVAVDGAGNVYVTDSRNAAIRKIAQ